MNKHFDHASAPAAFPSKRHRLWPALLIAAVFLITLTLLVPLTRGYAQPGSGDDLPSGSLPQAGLLKTIPGDMAHVTDTLVDPVRQKLYIFTAMEGRQLVVVNLNTFVVLARLDLPARPGVGVFSPDRSLIYILPLDPSVKKAVMVLDTATLKVVRDLPYECKAYADCEYKDMVLGPGNRLYLMRNYPYQYIDIMDAGSAAMLKRWERNEGTAGMAVHGADLYLLDQISNAPFLRRYDISEVEPVLELEKRVPVSVYQDLNLAPDGSFLTAVESDSVRSIVTFDAATLELKRLAENPEDIFWEEVPITFDSRRVIAFHGWVPTAIEYDAATGAAVRVVQTRSYKANQIVPLTGGRIALLSNDRMEFFMPSVATVLVPLTANRHCGGGPVYDRFDDPASGWPIADRLAYALRYIDSRYSILLREGGRWQGVTRGDVWVNATSLTVTTRKWAGDGYLGIVYALNQDWTDFRTFEIAPDYHAAFLRHYSEENGWTTVEMRQVGGGTGAIANKLSIEVQDGMMRFRLNDSYPLFEHPVINGRVGLSGASFAPGTDLRHDEYRFVGQNCDVENPQQGDASAAAEAGSNSLLGGPAIKELPLEGSIEDLLEVVSPANP